MSHVRLAFCNGCEDEVPYVSEDPVCQVCGTELPPPDSAEGGGVSTVTGAARPSAHGASMFDVASALRIAGGGGDSGGGGGSGFAAQVSPFDLVDMLPGPALAELIETAAQQAATSDDGNGDPGSEPTAVAAAAPADAADAAPANTNDAEAQLEHLRSVFSRFLALPDVLPQLGRQSPPASTSLIDTLPSRVLSPDGDRWLQQLRVSVGGIPGNIVAEPANFGHPVHSKLAAGTTLSLPLVAAEPLRADSALRNPTCVRGKAVLCQRGGCTFAAKAMRCQEAGAAAVVVLQSVAVWPYTMTDSTGVGDGVRIPLLMVKLEHGRSILAKLRQNQNEHQQPQLTPADGIATESSAFPPTSGSGAGGDVVVIEIAVSKKEEVCPICFEAIVDDSRPCTQLPCLHVYHKDCITTWLRMRNTCPTCRHSLPTDDPEFDERERRARAAVAQRHEMATSWYS